MIDPKHHHLLAAIHDVSRDVSQALRMIYASRAYKSDDTKISGAAMFLEGAEKGLEFAMRSDQAQEDRHG